MNVYSLFPYTRHEGETPLSPDGVAPARGGTRDRRRLPGLKKNVLKIKHNIDLKVSGLKRAAYCSRLRRE